MTRALYFDVLIVQKEQHRVGAITGADGSPFVRLSDLEVPSARPKWRLGTRSRRATTCEWTLTPPGLANILAMQVNMHEAKTRLSELVAAAERGEEVLIARNGRPAVRLVAVTREHSPVRLGVLAGQIELADDFDEPLPEFGPYTA